MSKLYDFASYKTSKHQLDRFKFGLIVTLKRHTGQADLYQWFLDAGSEVIKMQGWTLNPSPQLVFALMADDEAFGKKVELLMAEHTVYHAS